jgi:predicted membrane protein
MKTIMERRFLAGIVLITVGTVLLINYMDLIPYELPKVIFSWTTLLILLGVIFLLTERNSSTGVILILIGSVFFIADFQQISVWEVMKYAIPVGLIIAGLLLLLRKQSYPLKKINGIGNEPSGDILNDMSIFGGGERKIRSGNFRGGRITAVFGGSELDLRTAELAPGVNAIDVLCLFGGFTLRIPEDWEVVNEVSAVFGGFSDKRMNDKKTLNAAASDKLLYIKGLVLFGGGEIK